MALWGIMGGSFNPVHYGHLLAAEEAAYSLELEKVLFIPTGNPPHKSPMDMFYVDAFHRLRMTEIAVEDNPRFQPLPIETVKKKVSYTYDTVRELKENYGQDFVFIAGADSLLNYSWYRLDDLLNELYLFLIQTRPGFPLEELEEKLASMDLKNGSKIRLSSIPAIDISSSDIRHRLKCRRSVRYMLPDRVIEYIVTCNLYK